MSQFYSSFDKAVDEVAAALDQVCSKSDGYIPTCVDARWCEGHLDLEPAVLTQISIDPGVITTAIDKLIRENRLVKDGYVYVRPPKRKKTRRGKRGGAHKSDAEQQYVNGRLPLMPYFSAR